MKKDIFKYGEDIIWSLPLLFQYEPVYGVIVKLLNSVGIKTPEANVFGSPQTIWSGGRSPALRGEFPKYILDYTFDYLENLHGVPTFTFTRTDITVEDLKSKYENYLLDYALEREARFIVASDILKDYIKEKDANATVIASVIKAATRFQGPDKIEEATEENETNYYNKLLKEYDIVVVRPEYSKFVLPSHPEYIDDYSRIEVLINSLCVANCPKMPEHYKYEQENNKRDFFPRFNCTKNGLTPRQVLDRNVIHSEETIKKLIKMGVKHLKFQGRGSKQPFYMTLMFLFSQMFNFDGDNYGVLTSLTADKFDFEVNSFSEIFQNQNDVYSLV